MPPASLESPRRRVAAGQDRRPSRGADRAHDHLRARTGLEARHKVITQAEVVLREVFGLGAFRPGQAEVVGAMLAGRDVLSVAPTRARKSISYWVPAGVGRRPSLGVCPRPPP